VVQKSSRTSFWHAILAAWLVLVQKRPCAALAAAGEMAAMARLVKNK
jgi:hypothetical protein